MIETISIMVSDSSKMVNIPIGPNSVPFFQELLKTEETDVKLDFSKTSTKCNVKEYLSVRAKLLKGVAIENTVSFGAAKVAELIQDIDFINKIPLDIWNFGEELSDVPIDALGNFTSFLVLRLLLELVMDAVGNRVKETWPPEIIGHKNATFQKIRTPSSRTIHSNWARRLEVFTNHRLAQYFWEKGGIDTRFHIATMLQIIIASRTAVSKLNYLTQRQNGFPEREGFAMGCQQDGKKNCDGKPKPCNQCKGLGSWLQQYLPKKNGAITNEMVQKKAQELWNADPKCSKFKNAGDGDINIIGSLYDDDCRIVRDTGAYLNGSEIDDGITSQWAEKMSEARRLLTLQQNKKRKGSN